MGFATSFVKVAIMSFKLTHRGSPHTAQEYLSSSKLLHLKEHIGPVLGSSTVISGKKILAMFHMCWVLFILGAPSGGLCPSHFSTGLFPALPRWIGHHGKPQRQEHSIFNPFMFADP